MKLLLFNPETEYALASGASFYTPPARVEKLRKEMQLLPESWAEEGDMILVDDAGACKSNFKLVDWNMLESIFAQYPDLIVDPWGWNQALVRKLMDYGVPAERLPDEKAIKKIRDLAHRRTTVLLAEKWNEIADDKYATHVPVELATVGECMEFYHAHPGCWLKAPWSSSGRGVINTAADMTPELVEQWCRGIVRRQGSVMGEIGAERIADFATEWEISAAGAQFIKMSSFSTSNRGKYISNDRISQEEMRFRFDSLSSVTIENVIALQKRILQEVLVGYEGLCGIDMLVERDSYLRPFVELNLRRTMGML